MNFNNKEKVDPGEKEKKYLFLLFWLLFNVEKSLNMVVTCMDVNMK